MRVTTPVSRNDGHFPIKFKDIPLRQTQQRHFRPLNLRNIQMTDKELMSAELNRLREQALWALQLSRVTRVRRPVPPITLNGRQLNLS